MKEDLQRVHSVHDALRALIGQLGSASENVSPPDNSNVCMVT
jgi:hypothetical protein